MAAVKDSIVIGYPTHQRYFVPVVYSRPVQFRHTTPNSHVRMFYTNFINFENKIKVTKKTTSAKSFAPKYTAAIFNELIDI